MSDNSLTGPVGVLGAGVMGSAMAACLTDAGFDVRCWDIDGTRLASLQQAGMTTAATRDDLLASVATLIVSLPGPPQVQRAVAGADGLLRAAAAARPDLVVLDTSTVDPVTSRGVAEEAASFGVHYLASPVIGGEPAARAGTLTMIVGGQRAAFDAIEPVLDTLAGRVTHVPDPGAASTLKLVNNLMSLTNTVALMEGLAVAARNGVDAALVHEALQSGSGYSAAFERRWSKHLSKRDFDAGFSIDLAIKDLSLVQELAREVGLPLPASAIALQIYRTAALEGLGTLDVAALALWWEDLLDTRFTD